MKFWRRFVVQQEAPVPEPLARREAARRLASPPAKKPHELLSARELDVMLLTSRGTPLKDIADRLHLSPKTVSTYRARVLEKMGLSTNAELTRYVIEHKLDP